MTQTTLKSVALKTIGNYRKAAAHAVGAYRNGGHRAIRAVDARVGRGLQGPTARFAPTLAAALQRARGGLADVALRGVDALCAGTSKAIELGSEGVAQQVQKAAALAAGVDNRLVANGLTAAARLSLPTAKAVLALSAKVAEGAGAVSTKVAGKPAAKPAAKGTAKRAPVRAGAKAGRRVARAATKAGAAFDEVMTEMTARGRRAAAGAKAPARARRRTAKVVKAAEAA